MSTETVQVVNSMEAIRHLPLNVASLKGDALGDAEVIAITELPSLRELDLSGCEEVTDHSISELSRVSSLEEIDLSFCNQITDTSLTVLAGLPALRLINLNWCYGVTDSGLNALGRCESLESVSLWSCEEVTDEGIEALAKLPRLRILELPEFAAITDRALVALSVSATKLESVRLDHLTGISDQGFLRLVALKQLRSLTVHSCPNITADAVASVQKALQECQISFKN